MSPPNHANIENDNQHESESHELLISTNPTQLNSDEDSRTSNKTPLAPSSWRNNYTPIFLLNFLAKSLPSLDTLRRISQSDPQVPLDGEQEGLPLSGPMEELDAIISERRFMSYLFVQGVGGSISYGVSNAAWSTVGDRSSRSVTERLALTHTLLAVELAMCAVLIPLQFVLAPYYTPFEPVQSMTKALATCARALDMPEVPVIMALLHVGLVSWFDFWEEQVVAWPAWISRFAVPVVVLVLSLLYLNLSLRRFMPKSSPRFLGIVDRATLPSWQALRVLFRPMVLFAIASGTQAVISWALEHDLLSEHHRDWAEEWSLLDVSRFRLLLAGMSALEATAATFVGHEWGRLRASVGIDNLMPKVSRDQVMPILRPVLLSTLLAFLFELSSGLSLVAYFNKPYTTWTSSKDFLHSTQSYISNSIGWTYLFQVMTTQLSVLLYATRPSWYMFQVVLLVVVFTLPLMVVRYLGGFEDEVLWKYETFVLGATGVLGFFVVGTFDWLWVSSLGRGKMRLDEFVAITGGRRRQ